MSRTPRSLTRRPRRSNTPAAAAQTAPSKLRQRVLGTVRGEAQAGEDPRSSASSGGREHWSIAACIVAAAALTLAGIVALNHSSTARTPASSTADARGARATRASLRRVGTRTELIVSHMPQPPIGEAYEVWLDRAGEPAQPTDALFTVTSSGDGAVEVPGVLRGVREVMVTSEPLGGSSAPTSTAVLRLRVAHSH
jgi:Anti-sigma-K factor rskA